MSRDEPSIAGLALSGLLWATAIILTGAFIYSAVAPREVCSGSSSRFGARDTIAVFEWPPPMLRCATGSRFDGRTEAEREWETLWDWPQLAAVAVIDVLALAELARRSRARKRRFEPDRPRRGWPPRWQPGPRPERSTGSTPT